MPGMVRIGDQCPHECEVQSGVDARCFGVSVLSAKATTCPARLTVMGQPPLLKAIQTIKAIQTRVFLLPSSVIKEVVAARLLGRSPMPWSANHASQS